MLEHRAMRFRNQQIAERKGSQLARIVTEKRLRAAIAGEHAAAAVQNQNTIGRSIQNCPKFTDLLLTPLRRCLGLPAARTWLRIDHQSERALAAPCHAEQATFARLSHCRC